jgi:hypothetical protein
VYTFVPSPSSLLLTLINLHYPPSPLPHFSSHSPPLPLTSGAVKLRSPILRGSGVALLWFIIRLYI